MVDAYYIHDAVHCILQDTAILGAWIVIWKQIYSVIYPLFGSQIGYKK